MAGAQTRASEPEPHIAPEARAARLGKFGVIRRGPVNVNVRRKAEVMSLVLRAAFLVLIAVSFVACFVPHTKRYEPKGDQETQLFPKARRDVYPEDVRKDLNAFDREVLLWTGIVKSVGPEQDGQRLRMRIEHHYWDWLEDYSVQREIAFLSPRGEGMFACDFRPNANLQHEEVARVEDMAIIYGTPHEIANDGMILMACPYYKTLRRELYATDVFSYGRNFSDLKVLRIPGVED